MYKVFFYLSAHIYKYKCKLFPKIYFYKYLNKIGFKLVKIVFPPTAFINCVRMKLNLYGTHLMRRNIYCPWCTPSSFIYIWSIIMFTHAFVIQNLSYMKSNRLMFRAIVDQNQPHICEWYKVKHYTIQDFNHTAYCCKAAEN